MVPDERLEPGKQRGMAFVIIAESAPPSQPGRGAKLRAGVQSPVHLLQWSKRLKGLIMLRTSFPSKLLTLCLLVHAGVALAQQPQPAPPKPSEAPPRLQVEDGPNTKNGRIAVDPKPAPGAVQITEKKNGGVVTEVKVKSAVGEYTMKPGAGPGNAQPGDAQSTVRPATWTVLEFDLNKKKKAQGAATVDAPPPESTAAPAKARK